MLKHIENSECHNRWTIQHLNKLAEECSGMVHFIIPGRETWFRAGAPPLKAKQADSDSQHRAFKCSICDKRYVRSSQLKEHLEEQECSHDYPSVLRCPWCPDSGFKRLSELFDHLERQRCQRGENWVRSLVQSLKKKFEDIGVQRRLDKDSVRLRADKERTGRKLCVETRNLDDHELEHWRD